MGRERPTSGPAIFPVAERNTPWTQTLGRFRRTSFGGHTRSNPHGSSPWDRPGDSPVFAVQGPSPNGSRLGPRYQNDTLIPSIILIILPVGKQRDSSSDNWRSSEGCGIQDLNPGDTLSLHGLGLDSRHLAIGLLITGVLEGRRLYLQLSDPSRPKQRYRGTMPPSTPEVLLNKTDPTNSRFADGDFISANARTSEQRGHFGRPRCPEKPNQTSARERLMDHLLPRRPLLKLSALVRPR